MLKDVFEGTAATVAVSLTRGRSDAARTARLVFTATEGVSVPAVDLQLPAKPFIGKAAPVKHKVEFPDVPEGKDSYEIQYHLEWDGHTLPGADGWRVWPYVVDLTTKRQIEGELTEAGNVPVQLRQGSEARVDCLVPMAGKAKLLVPEPGPFEIVVLSPQRLVGWTAGKDKGRVRELEWDIVPHKARIELPAGEDTIRTHVNVGFRNEVKIQVLTATHGGDVAPNQDVYVEAVFTNPTKRGSADPKPVDPDYLKERSLERLDSVQPSADRLTWKGKIRTGGDGKADFALFLGKGGGETCTLKVGSTATVEDASRSFETWRKIFVMHAHSGSAKSQAAWPVDKRAGVKQAYEQVFIEIDFAVDGNEDSRVIPADLAPGARCGWVDGEEIDGTPGERCFVVNIAGDEWEKVAKAMKPADAEQAALFIHVAAADLLFEAANRTIGKSIGAGGTATIKGTEASPNAQHSFGSLPKLSPFANRATYEIFRVVDYKKQRPAVAQGEVPADRITVSSSPKADRGTLTVKLPDDVIRMMADDPQLEGSFAVDAMMKVVGAGAEGVSNGGSSIVLSENANGDAETINTIIHEIGHAIGMCGDANMLTGKGHASIVNRLPDYALAQVVKKDGSRVPTWSFKDHPRWYDNRGHQGNHCANGLGDSAYKAWGDLDGFSARNIGSYKCVIYGQAQAMKTPVSYCSDCQDMLKAMEVWVGSMPKG